MDPSIFGPTSWAVFRLVGAASHDSPASYVAARQFFELQSQTTACPTCRVSGGDVMARLLALQTQQCRAGAPVDLLHSVGLLDRIVQAKVAGMHGARMAWPKTFPVHRSVMRRRSCLGAAFDVADTAVAMHFMLQMASVLVVWRATREKAEKEEKEEAGATTLAAAPLRGLPGLGAARKPQGSAVAEADAQARVSLASVVFSVLALSRALAHRRPRLAARLARVSDHAVKQLVQPAVTEPQVRAIYMVIATVWEESGGYGDAARMWGTMTGSYLA